MKDSVLTTKGWALLIVAAVLVAAGTINFAQRLTHKPPPTDGIDWVKTDDGIVVRSFEQDSPAGRKGVFGVLPGDRLKGVVVGDSEERDEVTTTYDVQTLPRRGEGRRAHRLPHRAPLEPRRHALLLDLPRQPAGAADADPARPLPQPDRRRLPAGRALRLLQAGRAGALRAPLRDALPRRLRLPLLQALRRSAKTSTSPSSS